LKEFQYRWLWTWDWRMNWDLKGIEGPFHGGGDQYRKDKESYLVDYKNLIEYVSEHGLNGVIIYGFIRYSHGGMEYARELCKYGNERDVRILPGVGTCCYEGYYYEGKHRYNMTTWLQEHPELRAVDEDGQRVPYLCASKEENQEWIRDGMKWLFQSLEDLRGVNVESNEFFVCQCRDCERRREEMEGDEPDYYKDLFTVIKPAVEAALEVRPDAWVSYATYTGFERRMMESPPTFAKLLPEEAICQWNFPRPFLDHWPKGVRPPTRHNVALGSLNYAKKTERGFAGFSISATRELCRKAAESGMEGVIMYGEDPNINVNNEINYLAFEEFSACPETSFKNFARRKLADLYGGENSAEQIVSMALSSERGRRDLGTIKENLKLAKDALKDAKDPQARERWSKVIARLEYDLRRIYGYPRVEEGIYKVYA